LAVVAADAGWVYGGTATWTPKLAQRADALAAELDEMTRALSAEKLLLGVWFREMADHVADCDQRGCALANAAIEIPEKTHPARRVIEEYKSAFPRRRRGSTAVVLRVYRRACGAPSKAPHPG
jgi:hypothetical protein